MQLEMHCNNIQGHDNLQYTIQVKARLPSEVSVFFPPHFQVLQNVPRAQY